jgi:menaquinone-dependent protoporphyrinogen IX oxidase
MTKTGTTKKAAEIIKEELKKNQIDVDVLELSTVDSLNVYDTIIIGGPINGMQWLPEIKSFINKNEEVLNNKNIACFALSYVITDGRQFWQKRINKNFNNICRLINPFEKIIFGGKIDKPMSGIPRFIFGLSKDSPLDYTDDKKIRRWSNKIIKRLK